MQVGRLHAVWVYVGSKVRVACGSIGPVCGPCGADTLGARHVRWRFSFGGQSLVAHFVATNMTGTAVETACWHGVRLAGSELFWLSFFLQAVGRFALGVCYRVRLKNRGREHRCGVVMYDLASHPVPAVHPVPASRWALEATSV